MDFRRFVIGLLPTVSLLGAFSVAPSRAEAADTLIGYVNLQRAILEVEEGKTAKNNLKATFDVKQKKLNDQESSLMKIKETIEKEAAIKDDPETRRKVADFQGKLMELQQTFVKEQKELQEAEQKELGVITGKMRKIIEEIGQSGSYTLILEIQDSRLLFAKPHLDLTNEVIRKYNAKYPKK
ncbi:MAG: OmpH family outer membrane protein [Myxococcota bacterium]